MAPGFSMPHSASSRHSMSSGSNGRSSFSTIASTERINHAAGRMWRGGIIFGQLDTRRVHVKDLHGSLALVVAGVRYAFEIPLPVGLADAVEVKRVSVSSIDQRGHRPLRKVDEW